MTMTRGILRLILVGIVLASQLSLDLANAEDINEHIADLPSSSSRESAGDSTVAAQYLLGVIEYNEGNVELAKIWFQRAWESLEETESKVTALGNDGGLSKTQAFGRALDKSTLPAVPAKIQFPQGYKVNVYYRDGWYILPKNPSVEKKQVYSFLPGSTYKIRVEPENEYTVRKKINTGMKVIGALVMISWLMSR